MCKKTTAQTKNLEGTYKEGLEGTRANLFFYLLYRREEKKREEEEMADIHRIYHASRYGDRTWQKAKKQIHAMILK